MTGKELQAALRKLDLTQEAFARMIDVSHSSVARWVQGRSRIPGAVGLLLERMLTERKAARRLSQRGRQP